MIAALTWPTLPQLKVRPLGILVCHDHGGHDHLQIIVGLLVITSGWVTIGTPLVLVILDAASSRMA